MDRKFLSFLLAAFLCVGLTAQAQENNRDRTPGAKPSMEQMAANMARRLKLDSGTTEWFIPVYAAYQDTLASLRRTARPVKKNAGMSEAEALQAIENAFKAAENEVALKRTFLPLLKERLTPQQLVAIFVQPMRERGDRMPQQGQRPMRNRGEGPGHNGNNDNAPDDF